MKIKPTKLKPIKHISGITLPDYCLQQKHDGIRAVLSTCKNKTEIRTRNKIDLAPYLRHLDIENKLRDTILDGELIHEGGLYELNRMFSQSVNTSNYEQRFKENRIRFVVFDVLQYRGKDVRQKTYLERLKILNLIFFALSRKNGFIKIKTQFDNFDIHISNFNFLGREGVVLKRLNSVYSEQGYKLKFKNDYSYIVKNLIVENKKLKSVELGYWQKNKIISAGKIRTNEYLTRVFEQGRISKHDIIDVEALLLTSDLKPRDGLFKCLRRDLVIQNITNVSLSKTG